MPTESRPERPAHSMLSLAQERLWVLEQFAPGNPVYHLSKTFRLSGPLQIPLLEKAFTEIQRRHELLRTVFHAKGGRPDPFVLPPSPFHLAMVDLRNSPAAEREHKARQYAQEQARQRFDLTRDSMWRAALLCLENTEHVLVINVHQIAADAASLNLLLQELVLLYEAFRNALPSPWPLLHQQYADFASRQRQWLASPEADKHLEFWSQQLTGVPALFEFSVGRARSVAPTHLGARHRLQLEPRILDGLKALAQQNHCSLRDVLLAAFAAMASRYAARTDVVLGLTSSHRNEPVLEDTIGNFSNLLVVLTNLNDDPVFPEIIRRTRAALAEAQAHGQFPFEGLVEYLKPPRDTSHHPLVQVNFVWNKAQKPNFQLANLVITPFEIDFETTPFDLTMEFTEAGGDVEGWLIYATDLFNPTAIRRMAGHFEAVLQGILSEPAQPLSRLPLLTEAERQQILVKWNDTRADSGLPNQCLHHLFEAQVEKSPEATAVVCGDRRVTYRELNGRANRLARHLQELGVGPEVLVGICTNRSIEMVAGILAVLKAGGAYVPLDPAYPAERLGFILEHAKTPVLATESGLSSALPDLQAKRVLVDDPALWSGDSAGAEANPVSTVKPHNLAYVIYTSGSTGRPKGVALEHRSPVNFVHWAKGVFSAEELAGVLACTSICFDLSVFEMFVPLSAGGKIILAENALQFPKLPAANEVTLINTVPSAIAELVRSAAIPRSVRTVNLAGEPLETALVKLVYQQSAAKRVYDLYGPTETTIYSTFALRTKEGPPTIGRPIANTQIYLVDEHLQPVPIGVPGELYIGGAGLARGYLYQPELTSERFVPNPFLKGQRLYRTGDLARYREDGNIEFLGRKDNQVKIRGFRLELGEIETVLRQNPALTAAVVVASEDPQGDKRLVAYFQSASSETSGSSDFRAWLRTKLPEYMIPAVFVPMPTLPLTPNGKIDRKALPSPEQVRSALKEGWVKPRTDTEKLLAEIWCDVLGLDQVGIHDNFFELGGHSLRSIQVISRLRDTVQVELSMRDFFEKPTIAELAGVVEKILVQEISELSEEEAESLARSA